MAVARTRAKPAWFRKAAQAAKDHPKLARELLHAASRPGRTAELTAPEALILSELMPGDEIAAGLLRDVRASEERERAAHDALQARLAERRGF